MTETSPEWLKTDPERYLEYLRNSPDPKQQEAARLLDDVIEDDAPYDAMVVMSRPRARAVTVGAWTARPRHPARRASRESGHHRRPAPVTFTFTREQLVAERDAAAARVAERPGKVSYQRLGRAHRWLDEADAAREAFRAGAEYMKANVLDQGRSRDRGGMARVRPAPEQRRRGGGRGVRAGARQARRARVRARRACSGI